MRLLPLTLPLLLGGCGLFSSTQEVAAPIACPQVGLLGAGANLTRHRPGPVRDLTTLDFDARLTGLGGDCRPGRGERAVDVTLVARFSVERGAAAEGRTAELPWYVAVIEPGAGDQVLRRVRFGEVVTFARNETRVSGESAPVTLTLPIPEGKRAADYRVLVSFQLSPEELELNRRRGPR